MANNKKETKIKKDNKDNKLYLEEFKILISTLEGLPDNDKERLIKSAIKFFNLNHILSSECIY